MKILIVDDELVNRKKLEKIVQSLGYETLVAADGIEGWEIWRNERPRLVITDWIMPGMDGLDLCGKIRKAEANQYTYLIMVTAKKDIRDIVAGMDAGADDFIAKPFVKEDLTVRISAGERILNLLRAQEVNIGLAKNILSLVNGISPRYIDLSKGMALFIDAVSVPCYAEGGDHYFVRNIAADGQGRHKKTVFSLKDQSGHEVGCVLRSIITDLMHNAILNNNDSIALDEAISRLNDAIPCSGLIDEEDFFTSINAEIDHEALTLRYVSTGHPPFLLIRGKKIMGLPEPGKAGMNIPVAVKEGMAYSVGEYQLKEGDKLIFYTDGLTEMPWKNLNKIMALEELKSLVAEIICRPKVVNQTEWPVSEIIYEILRVTSKMSNEEIVPHAYENGPKNTSGDDITILGMEIENWNNYYEEACKPKDSGDIAKFTARLYDKIGHEWDQRGYESPELRLRNVMGEAVSNAWKHGNNLDPNKSIVVRWRYGNDFHLDVIDEGEGFAYESIPDPTSNENIAKPSGRGIFIVRHFADSVNWKEGGKRLTMSFRKHPNPMEKERMKQAGKMMKLWNYLQ